MQKEEIPQRSVLNLVSELKWHLDATFHSRLVEMQLQFLTFRRLKVRGRHPLEKRQ